jgi:hypothetical protein
MNASVNEHTAQVKPPVHCTFHTPLSASKFKLLIVTQAAQLHSALGGAGLVLCSASSCTPHNQRTRWHAIQTMPLQTLQWTSARLNPVHGSCSPKPCLLCLTRGGVLSGLKEVVTMTTDVTAAASVPLSSTWTTACTTQHSTAQHSTALSHPSP